MKRLKIILQHNSFYAFIIVMSIFIVLFFTKIIVYKSKYKLSDNEFVGIVKNITFAKEYVTLKLECKESLTGFYYFKTEEEKEKLRETISLGDILYLRGNLIKPISNTNPNLFNYKKYLYYNRQFYTLNIETYKIIKKNTNPLYSLKFFLLNRLSDNTKTNQYIKAFVLGNVASLDNDLANTYRKIGISHLFSISGMHISLIMSIVIFVFKKIKINDFVMLFFSFLILFFYMFLVEFTPSVLRSGMFFIVNRINKVFGLELNIIKCFIISIFINILIDPFICYKVGFIYSSIISFYLILFSDLINKKNSYFYKLFMTSFIAWLVSIPISIYNFFEINLLSVFYNLIFVPLISLIVFPCSLLALVFNFLKPILEFFVNISENLAIIFSKIDSILILTKPGFLAVIGYFFIITFLLYELSYNKIRFLIVLIIALFFHYNWNYVYKTDYFIMLDVGQADSLILHKDNKTILIDAGGNSGSKNSKKNLNNIIMVLKSFGIRRIDYMITTHGDYDHMGEAINLVENFKVEKVIFNCGELNDLEQDLIKVLDKKKIKYYSCIKELNIDDNKLYFLNNKDYGNENDNSSVIYTELNNHKFLFMGDAGIEVEVDIMDKYNLSNIDVLKVGHHGSKTSTGKEFINEINPKYSVISVGKNNRYGHPNKDVLGILDNSKIYRTDQNGSIMFKIKNNKLEIKTCAP